MTIEDYVFGRMTVDGRVYTSDLIILPDGKVVADWWRRSGHVVSLSDLGPVRASRPEKLIIGTGANGRLRPDPGLASDLAALGIRMIAEPTAAAADRYNRLPPASNCAAAFHLTC